MRKFYLYLLVHDLFLHVDDVGEEEGCVQADHEDALDHLSVGVLVHVAVHSGARDLSKDGGAGEGSLVDDDQESLEGESDELSRCTIYKRDVLIHPSSHPWLAP